MHGGDPITKAGVQAMDEDEIYVYAKEIRAPLELVRQTKTLGRLPVVNFAAGGVATPADAALMMQLGMDGVFVGPADLAVCYGKTDINDPMVRGAIGRVGKAAQANGKSAVTFAPNADTLDDLTALGVNMMFFASEHSWMLNGARQCVADFKAKTA